MTPETRSPTEQRLDHVHEQHGPNGPRPRAISKVHFPLVFVEALPLQPCNLHYVYRIRLLLFIFI